MSELQRRDNQNKSNALFGGGSPQSDRGSLCMSPQNATPQFSSVPLRHDVRGAAPSAGPTSAATVMACWADAAPMGSLSAPSPVAAPETGMSGVSEYYETATRWHDTVSNGIHQTEQGFSRGIDWAEQTAQRPFNWAVEQSRGIPGLEEQTRGHASVSRHAAHYLGGMVKAAGGVTLGAANMVTHPIDTVTQLAEMGSHLPGMPFWMALNGYRHVKSLYEAARGTGGLAQVAATLDLPTILAADASYWKGIGQQVASPYRESLKNGKPMEAVGRGAFDLLGLLTGVNELSTGARAAELAAITKAEALSVDASTAGQTASRQVSRVAGEISESGYRAAPGERAETKSKYRERRSHERAVDVVSNADQPLENPKPGIAQHGHGHARHGYQTTEAQQADRVVTGRYPDQLPTEVPGGKPRPRASRFSSAEAEAEALGRARRVLNRELKAGSVGGYTDPVTGVQTYVDPATGIPISREIVVTTNRPGGFGTSQVVRRHPQPSTSVLPDAAGNRVAVPSNTVLPNARVTFEYVPSTGEWRPVTYFPEPAPLPSGQTNLL